MEHDHMIEALASNGSNHSLDIGSLPRRAQCRQNFANSHVSHLFSEVIAKDRIAVPQHVTRGLVKGKCLPHSCCPVHSAVGWAVTLSAEYDAGHGPTPETRKGPGS